MQRLDKLLSEAGVASRKDLRTMIRAGRVQVDGKVATSPETKVDETAVRVLVDGQEIGKRRTLVPDRYRAMDLKPVGRLDKDTEGLLLLTNDGALAHRILSPRHGVWKRYYAEHAGEAGPDDAAAFAQGIVLRDGDRCLPARLLPQGPGKSIVEVQEGKYHQVRRMLASRGLPVTYLRREAEGGLELGDLPLGETREVLPEAAVQALFPE